MTPQPFNLRPYQAAAIAGVSDHIRRGHRRLLVAMATGTGKTIVFATMIRELNIQGRVLVMAHREELLDQAAAKIRQQCPGRTVGIEQGPRKAGDVQVVVGSIQSLHPDRLAKVLNHGPFDLVIVDEAHHAVSKSYLAILDAVDAGGRAISIGVTATPTRGDGVGLREAYEHVAFEMGIEAGIREGWLAPIVGHRVQTGASLAGVGTRAGEFINKELADAVDTDERNALILKAYRELCAGRRALAFCVNVEHARHVAEAFNEGDVSAAMVCAATPKPERRETIERFAAGDLRILTNCGVFTEGFDDPGVGAVLMARPTKSSLLYAQMAGRGLRLAPGKNDCQLIDFADSSARCTLNSATTLVGLPPMDLQGRPALEVADELEQIQEEFPWIDTGSVTSVDDLALVTEQIEFFQKGTHPDVGTWSKLAWLKMAAGGYRLPLPKSEVDGVERKRQRINLEPDHLGVWSVVYRDESKQVEIGKAPTLREAVNRADEMVHRHRPDALKIVNTTRGWRDKDASSKQLDLISKLGYEAPKGISKGMASTIIDHLMGGKKKRKKKAKK